ncbi:MAG: PAS domain S-box protein, partial [Phenylobacterium sp.]
MDGFCSDFASAAERYGTYWRDTPESLFTVRVLPGGEFRFDGLNPAHERRTGLSNADLVGRTPAEALSPEAAAAVTERYQACVQAGEPITYHEWLELPGGGRHWETSLAPLRDENGAINLLLGSARDVTERVEAQAALARSEAQLRLVSDMIPDILFTAPYGGGMDYANSRFFEYTGLPRDSSASERQAMLHPDDLAALSALAARHTGGVLQSEARLRRHDGELRWFRIRAETIDGPRGPRWVGVATDIHEAKAAADHAAALNRRLSQVLASITDGYYTVGRDWIVTAVNDRTIAWSGRDESQWVGRDIRDIAPQGSPTVAAVAACLEQGTPERGEMASGFRPGSWVEFYVYPSADGATVLFHDVTERKTSQAEVEDAHALLQGSLDAMTAEIALLDQDGVIVAVNAAWAQMIGETGQGLPQAGVGDRYVDVFRNLLSEVDPGDLEQALEDLRSGRLGQFTRAYAGGARWRQLRINRFEHGGAIYFVAAREDVTEVVEVRAALRETTARLLSVRDEERHRIALE